MPPGSPGPAQLVAPSGAALISPAEVPALKQTPNASPRDVLAVLTGRIRTDGTEQTGGTACLPRLVEQRDGRAEERPAGASAESGTAISAGLVEVPVACPGDAQSAAWPVHGHVAHDMEEPEGPVRILTDIGARRREAIVSSEELAAALTNTALTMQCNIKAVCPGGPSQPARGISLLTPPDALSPTPNPAQSPVAPPPSASSRRATRTEGGPHGSQQLHARRLRRRQGQQR